MYILTIAHQKNFKKFQKHSNNKLILKIIKIQLTIDKKDLLILLRDLNNLESKINQDKYIFVQIISNELSKNKLIELLSNQSLNKDIIEIREKLYMLFLD